MKSLRSTGLSSSSAESWRTMRFWRSVTAALPSHTRRVALQCCPSGCVDSASRRSSDGGVWQPGQVQGAATGGDSGKCSGQSVRGDSSVRSSSNDPAQASRFVLLRKRLVLSGQEEGGGREWEKEQQYEEEE